jgi:hypothetical protein
MNQGIVFAAETEERSLYTFASEVEAIAYCEGLDVEAAIWLFWDWAGKPLAPVFSTANKRGLLVAQSGTYRLTAAEPNHHTLLSDVMHEFTAFEGSHPFNSRAGVLAHLRDAHLG